MFISKVLIKNYKSIENLNLSFSKGKNIIVGQNNSGKSNIISAINLVLGEKYPPKTFDENYYHKGNNSFLIILKLEECNIFDKSFLEEYKKKIAYYVTDDTDYFMKSSDEIEQECNASWIQASQLIEIISSAEATYVSLYNKEGEESIYSITVKSNGHFYRLKYVYKEMIASFMTSAIIPSERSIKSDLVINEYSWYGKLIKNVWKEKIIEHKEEIDENNKKLTQVTDNIFNGLTDELESSVKDAIRYNSISFKLIQDTKTDYYKGIKILLDDGYYSLLEDKGSGIKSLIIIELFKLYCKKYHKASSCLIVEEPEIFLHPQARSVLSKKIDQFLNNNENQTIITTHSEQFISNFDIRQLIFVTKESGKSQAYKILEKDFNTKEIEKMNIISSTENAEMFFADSIILAEGGEKYILTKLAEIYKGPLILNYNNVSIINVGGKSFFEIYKKMLEQLHKRVYIFRRL